MFVPHKAASTYLHRFISHLNVTYHDIYQKFKDNIADYDDNKNNIYDDIDRSFHFYRLTGRHEGYSYKDINGTKYSNIINQLDLSTTKCKVIIQIRNPFDTLISTFYSYNKNHILHHNDQYDKKIKKEMNHIIKVLNHGVILIGIK